MELQTIPVGPFQVNCYLYWDPQTHDGVIVDPGFDDAILISAIEATEMNLRAILLTHGHGDHIAAVDALRNHFSAPLYVGAGDEALLARPSEEVAALLGQKINPIKPDHIMQGEQVVKFGSVMMRVLATPGHTRGGVCFLDEKENQLFTGDTLFWGSIGRTDLAGGSMPTLLNSIKTQILSLPDAIRCYPGHGPETTVGAERSSNPFLTGGFYA